MKFTKGITGVLALAATAAFATALSAQTLQVLTAGSSAQFGPFAVAAFALAESHHAKAYHYTVKSGACPAAATLTPVSPCYVSLEDSRSVGGTTIPNEPGNLWVVWSTNGIWAYLSVDSTVGVRAFQAAPRATLALAPLTSLPVSSTSNYLYWNDNLPDTALTQAVYNALTNSSANTVKLTAANTDIRPEDALFATNRSLNTLGYGAVPTGGPYLIGNGIKSAFTSSVAHPISFALSGTDPISSNAVTAFVTIPIGAAPVVFLASNANDTASATNISKTNAALLFSAQGTTPCKGTLLDGVTATGSVLSPILREPLSGTMNTTEYSVFVPGGYSQETGVSATTNNPLEQPCATSSTGTRYRAIGTGESVNAARGTYTQDSAGNTISLKDQVAYAFFSYESTGNNSSYKYITLGGVDPIASSYPSGGALPSCNSSNGYLNCPVTGGSSFPHLRDGSYPAWSIYRVVTDNANRTNTQTLATEAQQLVNSTIPDFVPFTPVCKLTAAGTDDPGLDVYREHFAPSGITTTPNDGPLNASVSCSIGSSYALPYYTLGGQDSTGANTEAGGDVGGTIQGPFNSTTGQPTVPGPTQTSTH